jgi:hypothetical protein
LQLVRLKGRQLQPYRIQCRLELPDFFSSAGEVA